MSWVAQQDAQGITLILRSSYMDHHITDHPSQSRQRHSGEGSFGEEGTCGAEHLSEQAYNIRVLLLLSRKYYH